MEGADGGTGHQKQFRQFCSDQGINLLMILTRGLFTCKTESSFCIRFKL